MKQLSDAVRRQGVVRGAALWLRWMAFPPGGPTESFYRRFVWPAGRLLPRLGRPARVRGVQVVAVGGGAPIARILVLKLDHVGDFLLAVPSFALLRRSFPAAHVTLVCGPWNVALARQCGLFDAVRAFARFDARAENASPVADGAALAALGAFDLAVDLRLDADTRPLLGAVRARVTAGYRVAGGPALSIALPPSDPALHQRAAMLALVGAVVGALDPRDAMGEAVRGLAEPVQMAGWARPIVALSTGSGRAIKNWPLERYIALAGALRARTGGTVVLLGGADQAGDAAAMRAALGGERLVDRVGALSLGGSMGVLAEADLFIGNDSALGHASAALGRPTLVLFAGIDPLAVWAPLGARAVAIKTEIGCAPCHLSNLRACWNGHACMTAITVAAVQAQALALLGEQAGLGERAGLG